MVYASVSGTDVNICPGTQCRGDISLPVGYSFL